MRPDRPIMIDELKHGLLLPNGGESAVADRPVEFGVVADAAGWDGVFAFDHLVHPPTASGPEDYQAVYDPWITLAAIASRTDDISLGSAVTPVPRRQPWQLARDLATLDRLSDGRVILGAGLGSPRDYTRFGRSFDAPRLGEKFDEALDVIAGLWRGEPFNYDGDYYTVDNGVLLPTPVQEPRVPIIIGGWWPYKAAFQRGARWDGIIPNWPALLEDFPREYIEALPDHIRTAADKQSSHAEELREMIGYYTGLTKDPGEIVLYLPFGDSETKSNVIELAKELGATWVLHWPDFSSGSTHSENLEDIGEGPPR